MKRYLDELLAKDLQRKMVLTTGARQGLLVTGSAGMETWRHGGDSLASPYLLFRLHRICVHEWCEQRGATPASVLDRLEPRWISH